MDEDLYWAVRKLRENEDDITVYNRKLRVLARKYGYQAEWVAYTGSCIAGGMQGKHLHLKNDREDYCPEANNAAILF